MWRFILDPDGPRSTVVVLDRELTVGRDVENTVSIPDSSLSRRHARLEVQGTAVVLHDLGSKNGTFVDGLRVQRPVGVRPGAELRFGTVRARLDGPAPAAGVARALALSRATISGLRAGGQVDDSRRLAILLEVTRMLGAPVELTRLQQTAVELCLDVLDVEVAILELDRTRVWATRDGAVPEASDTALAWVRQHHTTGVFGDASGDQRLHGSASVYALHIGSCAAAPLLVEDRLLGVLYVDRRHRQDPFADGDVELLSGFAAQVALAADHARLGAARSALLRFFPPHVADHVLSSGLHTVEQQVTAVFCDISGYTELVEGMEPREVIGLLNRYVEVVTEVVFGFGGTLEKYIGDAVLAVWGAPVVREDDAERAVEAAMALRDRVAAVTGPRGPLRVHIGLHTGVVAAGNVGTATYLQFATVGAATNLAARLCGTAGAGEVVVSGATWGRLVGWRGEPLGPVPLKGVGETIERWRVLGRVAPGGPA